MVGITENLKMKLSTRTKYGMRAIADLAGNYGKGPMQLKTIAQNQGISFKYLEQIIALLKARGLVLSVRGPKGGYILAKAPNMIKLSDIFTALEGPLNVVECIEDKSLCDRVSKCLTRGIWADMQQAMQDILKSMTLQDMIEQSEDKKELPCQI